ncbi:MAG: tetratricopeptide repeat protein, partial [Byssovorax sp.]
MEKHNYFLQVYLSAHQAEKDWENIERQMPEVLESFARTSLNREPSKALGMLNLVQAHLIRSGRYEDYLRVLENVERSLEPDDPERALVLRGVGISLRFLGRYQEAVAALERSMVIDAQNNVSRRWSTLSEIAACYRAQGRLVDALARARQAVDLIDKDAECGAYAIAVSVLGLCYRDMYEPERAIECLEESLCLNKKMGNAQGEAIQLGNIAACHVMRGDTVSAMRFYGLALEIDEQIDLVEPKAKHLSGLGVCLYNIGDYVAAISRFEAALAVFKRLNLSGQEAVQLGRIADSYRAIGDLESAELYGRLLADRSDVFSKVKVGTAMNESAGNFRLRSATVAGMRSIERASWGSLAASGCGWHVILGENGAGKSSFLRAVALALVGHNGVDLPSEHLARWVRKDASASDVSIILAGQSSKPMASRDGDELSLADIVEERSLKLEVQVVRLEPRSLVSAPDLGGAAQEDWNRNGFSAAYGPFRRFSDGDAAYERMLSDQPRRARHISLFDSSVALTESLAWLRELHHKKLEKREEGNFLESFAALANDPGPPFFLPHGMRLADISSSGIIIKDGNGFEIPIEDLSDGYRAILSL